MPPHSQNLRILGEMAILKDNGKKMKGKLKDRIIMAMFEGYADNHVNNMYRFINLKTRKIMMSRDVIRLGKLYGDLHDSNNGQNECSMVKKKKPLAHVMKHVLKKRSEKDPT